MAEADAGEVGPQAECRAHCAEAEDDVRALHLQTKNEIKDVTNIQYYDF